MAGTRLATIIFRRDGRLYQALECTADDAQRWADEGYTVFQFAFSAGGREWAMLHANSQTVFTSAGAKRAAPRAQPTVIEAELLSPPEREGK